jgi:hypothetical protein
MSVNAYPEGYQDPGWDGTERDFGATVLPARAQALAKSLSAGLPYGMRLEWQPAAADADRLRQAFADACAEFAEAARMLHHLWAAFFPRQHRRCRCCNPCSYSAPLCINGAAYHRRQRARNRRRRS